MSNDNEFRRGSDRNSPDRLQVINLSDLREHSSERFKDKGVSLQVDESKKAGALINLQVLESSNYQQSDESRYAEDKIMIIYVSKGNDSTVQEGQIGKFISAESNPETISQLDHDMERKGYVKMVLNHSSRFQEGFQINSVEINFSADYDGEQPEIPSHMITALYTVELYNRKNSQTVDTPQIPVKLDVNSELGGHLFFVDVKFNEKETTQST